jgi:hypothetical protein
MLEQDEIEVSVNDYVFMVAFQWNRLTGDDVSLVGLTGFDADTGEEVELTDWLKVQFGDFNDKLIEQVYEWIDTQGVKL